MAKVKPDQHGIVDLVESREITDELERLGEAVAQAARASAPVLTGTYRDSIEVTERLGGGASIGSDVEYALVVEARTGNLARALDAAGGVS